MSETEGVFVKDACCGGCADVDGVGNCAWVTREMLKRVMSRASVLNIVFGEYTTLTTSTNEYSHKREKGSEASQRHKKVPELCHHPVILYTTVSSSRRKRVVL